MFDEVISANQHKAAEITTKIRDFLVMTFVFHNTFL